MTRRPTIRLMILTPVFLVLAMTASRAVSVTTPTVVFSTYLGGSGDDAVEDMTVDSAGNIYVTGFTHSIDYPSESPLPAQLPAIFVTKFDPTGTTTLYSVLLGGGNGTAIEVDTDGSVYVTGTAWELQTVNAYQPTLAGMVDGFIAKLDPTGAPVFVSYLGGTNIDEAQALAVDETGNMLIAGITKSTNFPLLNAAQGTLGGGYDVFLTKMNAGGTALVYSTFYGQTGDETPIDMVADAAGNVYVTGTIVARAFAHKWSAAGALVYETYPGGSSSSSGNGIALDVQDSMVVVGMTRSTDLPVKNAYQSSIAPGTIASFITRYSPDGTTVLYSTYLGGALTVTEIYDIAVDQDSSIYVAGITRDPNFPLVQPLQAVKEGTALSHDNFITRFNPDGQSLLFSTYWGGSEEERHIIRLFVQETGEVVVAGSTLSTDFPVQNAYQPIHGGTVTNVDAYLTKLSLPALPVVNVPQPYYFHTDSATLSWNRVSWATGYRVEVDVQPPAGVAPFSTDPEFEAEVDASVLSVNTGSLPDGTYQWRVQAQKADGTWAAGGVVQRFVISTVLP